jgi:5-hydroxyisourate hydrolase
MSAITSHVLDISQGAPARGVPVILELGTPAEDSAKTERWTVIGSGVTDEDGRVTTLLQADAVLAPGRYRLTFDTAAYFAARSVEGFYPLVTVVFTVWDAREHYHVPLLLSPFGYSTYRGS